MRTLGLILVIGGAIITSQDDLVLALVYIVLGLFLLKRFRHQRWLPKIRSNRKPSKRQQRKIAREKLRELTNKRATRKFNVRGVTHYDRQELLDIITIRHGMKGIGQIQLIPESDNEYDPDSIKIIFEDIGHIGYVPQERSTGIKEYINKNQYDIKWNIKHFENQKSEEILYMEIRLYTK